MEATEIYPNSIAGNFTTKGVYEQIRAKDPRFWQQLNNQFAVETTRTANSEIRLNNSSSFNALSKQAQQEAESSVKALGIKIKNKDNFKQFIINLRKANPQYKSALNNRRFVLLSKQLYNFKDGGKVNYSKLRK